MKQLLAGKYRPYTPRRKMKQPLAGKYFKNPTQPKIRLGGWVGGGGRRRKWKSPEKMNGEAFVGKKKF
uniref:Uncharacterized protein n=1 Tax=Solanum lycopersicum TaxID=4081 RepID=A0A3Q7ERG6_SOLLC